MPKGVHLSDSAKEKVSIAQKTRSHENQRGPAHGMWKGDEVGLTALHDWVKLRLPRPDKCQKCGGDEPLDLHNTDKKYTRDLTKWIYLCKKCHAMEEAPAREKCQTPAARKKRSESLTGHPVSEITRSRISTGKTKPRRQIECECGCGTIITTPGRWGEIRFVHGHNPAFRNQGKKNRRRS